MTIRVKRGLEINRSGFTPGIGEPIFTTDTKKLYIGDGSTPGGVEVDMTGGSGASAVTSVAGKTGDVTLVKADVGLSNVPNTDFTAAIAANTAKNSYPSADATKLAAITGTNTGDETAATIKTKLGIATLSGSNTGDQDLSAYATNTALSSHTSNVSNPHSVTKAQVGLSNVPNTDFTSAVAANTAKISFDTASSTKLAGIATGATVNSSDATLLARANHTGTQTLSTISDAGTMASKSGTGFSKISVGTTAPISPTTGDLWIDTN